MTKKLHAGMVAFRINFDLRKRYNQLLFRKGNLRFQILRICAIYCVNRGVGEKKRQN